MMHNHDDHICGCGCHHDHEAAGFPQNLQAGKLPAPEDVKFRQTLRNLQSAAASMQKLHAEIDDALAKVSRQNVGFILTQKKNVKKLEQLYEKCFAEPLDHPFYETMRQAEQEYLVNIKSILREAQQLKKQQASKTAESEDC